MHSSLRSSCIMFHEPIEKHGLTYTYMVALIRLKESTFVCQSRISYSEF